MTIEGIPADTTIEAARVQYRILRGLGSAARARMAIELSDELQAVVESGIRSRNPEYDAVRVRLESLKAAFGGALVRELLSESAVPEGAATECDVTRRAASKMTSDGPPGEKD